MHLKWFRHLHCSHVLISFQYAVFYSVIVIWTELFIWHCI